MATLTKTLDWLTGNQAFDLFLGMGSGDVVMGMWKTFGFVRKFAPVTNLWTFPYSITTTGGGATDTVVIDMKHDVVFAKMDFNATDLDTVNVEMKINGEAVLPGPQGIGPDKVDYIETELWDAFEDVPVLIGAKDGDTVEILFTDSGGGQAIKSLIVGHLVPRKRA